MRKVIMCLAGVTTVLAAVVVLFSDAHRREPALAVERASEAPHAFPSATPRLQAETARRTAMTKKRMALLVVESTKTHEERLYGAAASMTITFSALYDQRDYFDKDAIYEEILGELLEDPSNVEAAARALSDPDFLMSAFGKDQALGRIYAIKLLRMQAERGDPAALMQTARALFASVAQDGERVKGQYRDVESLVRAILGMGYESDELIERGADVVRDILLADGQASANLRDEALIDAVEAAFLTATFAHHREERWQTMAENLDRVLAGEG